MSNSATRRIEDLLESHLDALFRTAFRLARNEADAQDLVQETCVRACQRIATLDDSRHVRAWLLRVLHNLFVDSARRAQRSPVARPGGGSDRLASSPCTDPGPEESAFASQREAQLGRAWLKLDRGQRALLALRAEGYGPSEIVEITGLTVNVLNARLYRARRSFARHLKGEEANEPGIRVGIAQ